MWLRWLKGPQGLAEVWLAWEHLIAQGGWPGVWATPWGVQWLLENWTPQPRLLLATFWSAGELTGVVPLVQEGGKNSNKGWVLPGWSAAVPLGHPTVALLQLLQTQGGPSGSPQELWLAQLPWAQRDQSRWLVVARWRRWHWLWRSTGWVAFLPQGQTPHQTSPAPTPTSNAWTCLSAPKAQIPQSLPRHWLPWPVEQEAWKDLVDYLQRREKLGVFCLQGPRGQRAWLICAQEPCGWAVLGWCGQLHRSGFPLEAVWQGVQKTNAAWFWFQRWLGPCCQFPRPAPIRLVCLTRGLWSRWGLNPGTVRLPKIMLGVSHPTAQAREATLSGPDRVAH